ncbi:hypothetical protein [Nocardia sp. NPDC057030]|uniref:hypothetical protein n=1 Tax=unclassified Nocardia TaxID=2637762 RepID=UPI0036421A71
MSGENPYPSLGFNPVPGLPGNVATLRGQINTAYVAVQETNTTLNRLRDGNGDAWKGDAGNAFRAGFDATLGQDLRYAQSSLEKAVGLMDEWYTDIVSFQETAKGMETEAAAAITAQNQATTTLRQAQTNPDLQLANRTFDDPTALANAQTRLNNAVAQVNSARTAVDNADGSLAAIRQRAIELQTEYNTVSRRIATELDAAGKDFAPSPPDKSIWDRIKDFASSVGDWIEEHRDMLATISAVAGLLALVTPPPISAIALGVSLVAGAAVLGSDIADPELRNNLLHGNWQEKLSAIGTYTGDAVSLLPGASALGKVGTVAALGDKAADVGRLEGIANAWVNGAANPGLIANSVVKNNVGSIASRLDDYGLTNGVHRILQNTGAAGIQTLPSTETALGVLSRAGSSLGKAGTWGLHSVTGD